MIRSTPLQRKSPLKRTAMKSRRRKPTVAEGSKYLAACRGEPCYLRVPGVCCGDVDTVVPAHSNQSRHGKGAALKASHQYSVPGCFKCHTWIDQGSAPRAEKFAAWDSAYELWEPARALKMGIGQHSGEA